MKRVLLLIIIMLCSIASATTSGATSVTVGAERTGEYLPLLKGKRVGLYSNHTGINSAGEHTLDVLVRNGVDVRCIFSPEHGFRGTADAGEHVGGYIDPSTGVRVVSLYGRGKNRALDWVDSVDVVVTDIQDVGTRFYTYYCTMLELMNRALPGNKEFIVLDRPNPVVAMGVDGPVLDMKHQSGVGRLPIPVLHGMTLGELARMASGEGWLQGGKSSRLRVVPCEGYTTSTRYELPVAPSPNLPCMHAIYLYPSTCYFEGTGLSLGRGTDHPFEIYGHPAMRGDGYKFTPRSRAGAKNPPLLGKQCQGVNLTTAPVDTLISRGVDFSYIIDSYNRMGKPANFFTSFFTLLTGTDRIKEMIEAGMDAAAIKASWQEEVAAFDRRRQPYLLYR